MSVHQQSTFIPKFSITTLTNVQLQFSKKLDEV